MHSKEADAFAKAAAGNIDAGGTCQTAMAFLFGLANEVGVVMDLSEASGKRLADKHSGVTGRFADRCLIERPRKKRKRRR
jgi:hypothetical protein